MCLELSQAEKWSHASPGPWKYVSNLVACASSSSAFQFVHDLDPHTQFHIPPWAAYWDLFRALSLSLAQDKIWNPNIHPIEPKDRTYRSGDLGCDDVVAIPQIRIQGKQYGLVHSHVVNADLNIYRKLVSVNTTDAPIESIPEQIVGLGNNYGFADNPRTYQ